jgi:hypothetical protein
VRQWLITGGQIHVIRRQPWVKHLLGAFRTEARLCRQREIMSLLNSPSEIFHPRNITGGSGSEQHSETTYAHSSARYGGRRRLSGPCRLSHVRPLDLDRLATDGYGHVPLIDLPLRRQCGSRDDGTAVSGRSVWDE